MNKELITNETLKSILEAKQSKSVNLSSQAAMQNKELSQQSQKKITNGKIDNIGEALAYGGESFASGLLGAGEGIYDFIVGGIAQLTGNKEYAERLHQDDITGRYSQSIQDRYNAEGNKVVAGIGAVISTLGNMAPSIALGTVSGGAGLALMGVQAAGRGTTQAYQHTGQLGWRENAYGIGSGLMEVGIEKISGGLAGLGGKFGKGALDGLSRKIIKNTVIRGMVGEGLEEVVSTALDPILQRMTYDKDAEFATFEDYVKSFGMGSVTSGILQGGQVLVTSPRANKVGKQIQANNKTNEVINKAIDLKKGEAHDMAVNLKKRVEEGKATTGQIGRLTMMYNSEVAQAEIKKIQKEQGVSKKQASILYELDLIKDNDIDNIHSIDNNISQPVIAEPITSEIKQDSVTAQPTQTSEIKPYSKASINLKAAKTQAKAELNKLFETNNPEVDTALEQITTEMAEGKPLNEEHRNALFTALSKGMKEPNVEVAKGVFQTSDNPKLQSAIDIKKARSIVSGYDKLNRDVKNKVLEVVSQTDDRLTQVQGINKIIREAKNETRKNDLYDSGKRNDSEDTREQISRVAERAGRAETRQGISPENQVAKRLVSDTTPYKSIIDENAEYGLETKFYTGRININGELHNANGFTADNTIYVRDNVKNPEQIAKHERFHALKKRSVSLGTYVIDKVKSLLTEAEAENLLYKYTRAYYGVYDDANALLEEITADIYAGILTIEKQDELADVFKALENEQHSVKEDDVKYSIYDRDFNDRATYNEREQSLSKGKIIANNIKKYYPEFEISVEQSNKSEAVYIDIVNEEKGISKTISLRNHDNFAGSQYDKAFYFSDYKSAKELDANVFKWLNDNFPKKEVADYIKNKQTLIDNKKLKIEEIDNNFSTLFETFKKDIADKYENERSDIQKQLSSMFTKQQLRQIKAKSQSLTLNEVLNKEYELNIPNYIAVTFSNNYGLEVKTDNYKTKEYTDYSKATKKLNRIQATEYLKNLLNEPKYSLDYDSYMRSEMDKILDLHFAPKIETVKEYVKDRSQPKPEVKDLSNEDIKDLYKQKNEKQKEYDKVMKFTTLTKEQKNIADSMRKGVLKGMPPNATNKKQIMQVVKVGKELDAINKAIKDNKQQNTQKRHDTADEIIGTNQIKDKKRGFNYERETAQRNIREVFSPEVAGKINAKYFDTVQESETKKIQWFNKYVLKVKSLNLSKKESQLVQLLGEGKLASELEKDYTSEQITKAKKALPLFREIYNDVFTQLSDTLIKNGYEPPKYRQDYFPHFSESDDPIVKMFKKLGVELNFDELPTDIAGLTHTRKPGKSWFGNLMERHDVQKEGRVLVYDALDGLESYLLGAGNIIYQTDNIQNLRALENVIRERYSSEDIRNKAQEIREDYSITEEEKEFKLNALYSQYAECPHFVTWLRNYTDILANKKHPSDRQIEHSLGRKVYSIMKTVENRVTANMVGGNISSALTNFIPLTQAWTQVSTKNMLRGMFETARSYFTKNHFDSEFLTRRKGYEKMNMTKLDKFVDIITKPMYLIDTFTSESIVRARYYENMSKGMTHEQALNEADKYSAGIIADRSKGALPTIFEQKNPITKLFTMFQVEVNNQLSWLFKDLPNAAKDKGIKYLAGMLLKYFLAAFLFNEVYEKITGRRPALDPIGITFEAFHDYKTYDGLEATKKTAVNLLEEVPFVGSILGGGRIPISSALPDLSKIGTATFAEKELTKPLYFVLPPVAGSQIKKLTEGISDMNKGGRFTDTAEGEKLLYPIEQSSGNYIKVVLFGRGSTKEAVDYFKNDGKPLSVKQTNAYKVLTTSGINNIEAYKMINDISEIEGEKEDGKTVNGTKKLNTIKYIAKQNLSIEQKLLLIYLSGYKIKDGDVKGYSEQSAKEAVIQYINSLEVKDKNLLIESLL